MKWESSSRGGYYFPLESRSFFAKRVRNEEKRPILITVAVCRSPDDGPAAAAVYTPICGRRHDRCRVPDEVSNQMDRDNVVTAMETDKKVDDDIGNSQVRSLDSSLGRRPWGVSKNV